MCFAKENGTDSLVESYATKLNFNSKSYVDQVVWHMKIAQQLYRGELLIEAGKIAGEKLNMFAL